MEKIVPYSDLNNALQFLDNGGQLLSFRSKARDGIITQAELGKVGGVFVLNQQLILFLEMSILNLDQSAKDIIISKLDDNLHKRYLKYKSQELHVSEADSKGIISSNAIIRGVPKLVDSTSNFGGFIMFPMMSGNITTFMMIPIFQEYDVYEISDEESSEIFRVAHQKEYDRLPEKKIIVGGLLKELHENENQEEANGKFLEVIYYIED